MTAHPPAPREEQARPRWSLRFRLARRAHVLVNRLAWRFACPPGPEWGKALRVDKSHPLWRLNDWLADGWTEEWMASRRREWRS